MIGIKGARELFPEYYLDMLYEIYTEKEVDLILKSYLSGRKTTFRINRLKDNSSLALDELRKKNVKLEKCNICNDVYILKERSEKLLQQLDSYKKGYMYLQNISSILPAEILSAKEDDIVLDMCAAPGGKTLKIAENMNNRGKIIANEVNNIRCERLKYNIQKHGASNIEVLNLDGRRLMNNYHNYFDKILLDVPCSGEGTIKIKNTRKIKLLKNGPFAKVQKELIVSAFKCLKPGGIMVYSTCTICPQENEGVINYLLSKFNYADILPIEISCSNIKEGLTRYKSNIYDKRLKNAIRIIPNNFMEGFFLCIIKDKRNSTN